MEKTRVVEEGGQEFQASTEFQNREGEVDILAKATCGLDGGEADQARGIWRKSVSAAGNR
jgi:hypothetical protein